MSSQGTKARQQAQRKKAVALIMLMLCTGFVWSRTLFAGDDSSPAPAVTVTHIAASNVVTAPAPAISATPGEVVSYSTALQKLEIWPNALNRKVFRGSIEEITPINNLLNTVMRDAQLSNTEEPTEEESAEVADQQDFTELAQNIASQELELSTTAIFGSKSIAIINGEKYEIGDNLELQFNGQSVRYEVSAIHSRRVVLRLGENNYELEIANFKNASKSLNTNTDRLPLQRDSD